VTGYTAVGAELDSITKDVKLSSPDILDAEHKMVNKNFKKMTGPYPGFFRRPLIPLLSGQKKSLAMKRGNP
jgi:hypothetical protein